MFLKSKKKIFIFEVILICFVSIKLLGNDKNAYELLKNCNNYYNWTIKNYKVPVDDKQLFNMGKCQGTIETIGRMMLTLCYETKRNMNINHKMTANLEGIRTIEIVKKLVEHASNDGNLRKFSSHSYLINFINTNWPCKKI